MLDDDWFVVCDRYLASSVAYGEAFGLDAAWLTDIQRFLPRPSVTIMLDIAPETAVTRKSVDRDRYERDLSLQARVRDSYHRLAARDGWLLLDGERAEGRDRRRRLHEPGVSTRAAVSANTSRTPAALQHASTRLQRRAGRPHVIDQ